MRAIKRLPFGRLFADISKMLPATRVLLFSGQAGIYEILMNGHRQDLECDLIAKPIDPLKLIEQIKSKKMLSE